MRQLKNLTKPEFESLYKFPINNKSLLTDNIDGNSDDVKKRQ